MKWLRQIDHKFINYKCNVYKFKIQQMKSSKFDQN